MWLLLTETLPLHAPCKPSRVGHIAELAEKDAAELRKVVSALVYELKS